MILTCAPVGARLDPVLDGVFHQRLQQQRRQPGAAGRRVERPSHAQPFAETHLLDGQVAPASATSSASVTDSPGSARAWRNSSLRSSSMASARAGSSRTRAIALLRVLNRKCGRMRACSSDSRAAVSAGMRPLARSTSAATMQPPTAGRRRRREASQGTATASLS